jgi:hypothetical protein
MVFVVPEISLKGQHPAVSAGFRSWGREGKGQGSVIDIPAFIYLFGSKYIKNFKRIKLNKLTKWGC